MERAYEVISLAGELEAIGKVGGRPSDPILFDFTTLRMNGHTVCQAFLTTGGQIRSGLFGAGAVP